MHERIAWPSTCIVQAPHCATPQPNLEPIRPRSSRTTHSNGVSDSASTDTSRPLRMNFVVMITFPSRLPTTETAPEAERHPARSAVRTQEELIGCIAASQLRRGVHSDHPPRPQGQPEQLLFPIFGQFHPQFRGGRLTVPGGGRLGHLHGEQLLAATGVAAAARWPGLPCRRRLLSQHGRGAAAHVQFPRAHRICASAPSG